MRPIRVLYVNGGIMDRGGISAYMMNYYRHIDRSKVQIDFVVHGFEKGVFDDEIQELGGVIYNVPVKSKDYFGNVKALREIFRSEKYKIVHSHMDAMGAVVLKEAKKCGIQVRIAHSHNTEHLTNNKLKYIFNEIARKNITKYSTQLCACSEAAGRWLFGDANTDGGRVTYIKNAIELDKYKFDGQVRAAVRKEYGLDDSFIVGHIGRFDHQKNHSFLLEKFRDVLKERPDSILFLVGDGHLRGTIEAKIKDLGIIDNVIMAGVKEDIYRIINGFDVFCLPSLFEGLGIVLIEAQANGLKCIVSQNIPSEANVSGETIFLALDANPKIWVDSIIASKKEDVDREIDSERYIDAGYAIPFEAEKLQNIYLRLSGVTT